MTDTSHASITLRDGRKLAYAEYGDQAGVAVFYFHGTPGSRREGTIADEAAMRLRVRLIAIDRPGLGFSSFKPRRKLRDWPSDVVGLADALGIDRFAIVGLSGGGPHALAGARYIGDRLIGAAIVSGAAATAPGYAQRKNIFKRVFYAIAARATSAWAPVTAWWMMRGLRRTKPERMTTWPDPRVLSRPNMRRLWRDDLLEGFRHGSRGVAQDIRVLAGKWDFRLEDIDARVYIWHGDKDRIVPIDVGRFVAETIPHAEATYFRGEGHLLIVDHIEEILRALVERNTRKEHEERSVRRS
jgi:pimeloyl-ACP methyl ester carboxylesterase